jgi:hypothetical protein
MKLIGSLFQIAALIFVQVIFASTAFADTNDVTQPDVLPVAAVSSGQGGSIPHSAMAIVTSIKSEFVGVLVSLVGIFLFGRAILLLAGRSVIEQRVTEIPAKVPPLRPSIARSTKF